MTISGDQSLLREINRMAIVRAVQQGAGLSRADLAKATGLTKSTVGLLVQDLIDSGWLCESDVQATGAIGHRVQQEIAGGRGRCEASVGKGLVMKRFQTRGRGRAAGIVKPFAHLTIVVRERAEAEDK